jgi:glycosyltransferase involved in cell wall biosynthesis
VTLLDARPAERGERAAAAAATPARRKPRVVLLQTQAEAAGAQEISRILGLGLAARGHEMHHVFLFRRTAAFDSQPDTFFCAPARPRGPAGVARMFAALVRHLRALDADALLCFQHYGNLVGAAAAPLAGIRTVVANRTSAISLVPRWARALDLALGASGRFARVVVNSAAVEQEYRGYPAGYRARVRHIDHGFAIKHSDVSREMARRRLGLPAQAVLLGSVARLHPGKNLGAAVRLLAGDAGWHLALAGQGAERDALARLAQELGVGDRLHFAGELSADGIGLFLRALDLFVFPTLAETFGLAAVEAAQAGIPVVANDLDVLREVLADEAGNPCALFADAADADAFAGAVRRLLADGELAAALAARGRALARRYSLDAIVDRYAPLIQHAVLHSGR